MNTTLQTLTQLQEIDKVIRDIQQKFDALPEIMEQFDRVLSEGEDKVARLQASIEEQEKTRRSKELDVESNLDQMKRYQNQLLNVKTNKEYSALLAEIKGLKSKNSLSEDDIIELMESVERAKTALAKTQEELATAKIRIQQEKQAKEAEQVQLQKHLDEQRTAHAVLAQGIDGGLLNEYTKLLRLRHGNAVTPVEEEGVCTGCHVALTPQMFAEVKVGGHLHRCPICFRFVYWPDNHPQPEEE